MIRHRQILVAEDDDAVRTGIVDALTFHGFAPVPAANGETARRLALTSDWDLLLLDLVLPGADGFEILSEVRRARPTAPVIILTARGEEADRVRGLRLGADDYVVKPFSVRELIARAEAVLRRSPERPQPVERIELPGIVVDLARCEACFADGARVELSQREVELLGYLAASHGRAVSRDELLARLWRVDPSRVESRTIDMHVARLREKLRDCGPTPRLLVTVRGKGYMLARESEGS
ncbi:MAG: response regulator transcription factor [Planctomycetota bacterium]